MGLMLSLSFVMGGKWLYYFGEPFPALYRWPMYRIQHGDGRA